LQLAAIKVPKGTVVIPDPIDPMTATQILQHVNKAAAESGLFSKTTASGGVVRTPSVYRFEITVDLSYSYAQCKLEARLPSGSLCELDARGSNALVWSPLRAHR